VPTVNVLVAYASRHGATQGIAERIGATLGQEGLEVTVRSVQDARDVGTYDAYVIGSAAYMGGWLGEATTFVRRHHGLLAERPVWLFSSGPIGPEKVDKSGHDILEASMPKEFAEFSEAIQPRGTRVFFGAYDPDAPAVGTAERLAGRFFRLMPAAKNALPAGDFREWPEIEAWAREIARQLQLVPAGR
jgi:menaquinone-dependent protoporphyrinogen oxidase